MCGIVGYLGKKNGAVAVIDGLKRLEYRGYDSWGIAAINDGKIKFHKQVGKIGGFDLKRDLPDFGEINADDSTSPDLSLKRRGTICIGHTRWATHGGVTEKNSHPHFSCDKKIAVVHNGIVENYQELRAELEKKGHKFVSQTDTEVIAHQIEEESKKEKNWPEAVRKALLKLDGSYAVGIINSNNRTMIGARKGSPLVFGIGKDEFLLGSDVPAFLAYTNRVVFLDEFEMVAIHQHDVIISSKDCHAREAHRARNDSFGGASYQIINIKTGKEIKPKIETIKWGLEEAEKGGYPHFMIKEMLEQPYVVEKTIGMDRKELEAAAELMKAAKKIYIVACGTALHAGMYGAYLLALKNKLMVQTISAGEFPYFEHMINKGDLVITVSQSGETADVLESVRSAQRSGAKVLALVNVMGSSLMRLADLSLLTKAGPEICVLSTKAYVSQQAMFVMLSATLLGKVEAGKKILKQVQDDIKDIISEKSRAKIRKLAVKLSKAQNIYAIGRGVNYPTALEACLKIKEVSYIHAEGFAGGDLKHGPISLIEAGVPVLVYAACDGSEREIVSNAMEVKARGADVIGISFENNQVFKTYLPTKKNDIYSPIAGIVYAQLMAYYIALEKKLDPDKPRNLAKSVTVK